jgi:hypothetical protein
MSRFRSALGPLLLGLLLLLGGCSTEPDSDTNQNLNLTAADSIAAYWMQALADSLGNLMGDAEPAYYKSIRYSAIRHGMDQALAAHPACRPAHLGSALLDVIGLNYDPELWSLIDSLLAYTDDEASPPVPRAASPSYRKGGIFLRRGSPILGNQFTLLATAPRELLRMASRPIPSNLSVMRLQKVIDDVVLPALNSAIAHMEKAEAGGGPILLLKVEDEYVEIDLGEVYFFDASLRAARAGFLIMNSYDLDLPGPDGTYHWVDEIRDIESTVCDQRAEVRPIAASPYYQVVQYSSNDEEMAGDSVLAAVAEYNLMQRPAFLRARVDRMSNALQDLQTLRYKLELGVTAIRAEDDPQEDDVIRIADLIDTDSEIRSWTRPQFAANFTSIEDVLGWVETVLSGTYHVSESGDCGPIEVDVNLSAFFNNAPPDWRSLLPYYRFKPRNEWIARTTGYTYGYDVVPGGAVCFGTCGGGYLCRYDIARYDYVSSWGDCEPIEFLDGPDGNPIDLGVVKVPYLPDYTLAGLLPNATRATWLAVADALCATSGPVSSR